MGGFSGGSGNISRSVGPIQSFLSPYPGRLETDRLSGPYTALPGLHLANSAVEYLKERIHDGERGLSVKKAGAYLGFRLISYSCIPTAFNLISAVVCGLLALITLPLRMCSKEINDWCWEHCVGSLDYLIKSLFDLTCDLRQLTGICCCSPESLYRAI